MNLPLELYELVEQFVIFNNHYRYFRPVLAQLLRVVEKSIGSVHSQLRLVTCAGLVDPKCWIHRRSIWDWFEHIDDIFDNKEFYWMYSSQRESERTELKRKHDLL
jgi:hypothetical protein